MSQPVRVRFAPSPTGIPHVGNIRTALFNWLYARHTGGSFILRIEDTDVARTVPGAVEAIYDSLRWLGLDWNEGPDVDGEYGPYVQSQRLQTYRNIADQLIANGHAYHCYCTPGELEQMRSEQTKNKVPPMYDKRCRELNSQQRAQKVAEGRVPVVRFKMPTEGKTVFNDIVRGEVVFDNRLLDDFVLLKSDGYPTYHLANVIDDHLMEVSHVLRADEWLSSTPKHILLYRALGYAPPQFAHLSIILGEDRSKLSKRHGATSLIEYSEKGYLPEAVLNFLALLGWSYDDKTEIMTREELINNFSLEHLGKTGAIFHLDKLDWMNGVYVRKLSIDEFVKRILPFLEKGLNGTVQLPLDVDYIKLLAPLIQDRVKVLSDVTGLAAFFFIDNLEYDVPKLLGKGINKETGIKALEISIERLKALNDFSAASQESILRPLAAELGIKTGQLFGIIRIATTGLDAAPPLFQTMEVLGKNKSIRRLKEALEKLKSTT
ncbi:MAG: glutamate--tRNA ligase [Chloroflexi bacterium]|nr:glutamate--tRNA ligase [Chloroflexota bacterium]